MRLLVHSASLSANSFLFLNPAQLALGDEPTLPAHLGHNAVLGYLLAETPEQTLWRLVGPEPDSRQLFHHLFLQDSLFFLSAQFGEANNGTLFRFGAVSHPI